MRVLPLALALAVGAAAGGGGALAASKSFREHFNDPVMASLTINAQECVDVDGDTQTPDVVCEGYIALVAPPASKADADEVGGARPWAERLRWRADQIRGFVQSACVVDDGLRPKAFTQEVPLCAAAPAPDAGGK